MHSATASTFMVCALSQFLFVAVAGVPFGNDHYRSAFSHSGHGSSFHIQSRPAFLSSSALALVVLEKRDRLFGVPSFLCILPYTTFRQDIALFHSEDPRIHRKECVLERR